MEQKKQVFRNRLLVITEAHLVKESVFHNADIAPQAETSVGPEIGRVGDHHGAEEDGGTIGYRTAGVRTSGPKQDVSWQSLNVFNIPAAGPNGRRTFS